MAKFSYQDYQKENEAKETNQAKSNIGYLSLKKDGEEAIVRFMYTSPAEFELCTVHQLKIDDKYRKVNCIRSPHDPFEKCPLCSAGVKIQKRFFIKVLQYVRQEDGTIRPMARIWDRPANYADTLSNLCAEYNDAPLYNVVFKIKRKGAERDLQTSYDIIYANPGVYNASAYTINTEAFKDFRIEDFVWTKTYDELAALAGSPAQAPAVQPQAPVDYPQTSVASAPNPNVKTYYQPPVEPAQTQLAQAPVTPVTPATPYNPPVSQPRPVRQTGYVEQPAAPNPATPNTGRKSYTY